jgi:hypothetical protein
MHITTRRDQPGVADFAKRVVARRRGGTSREPLIAALERASRFLLALNDPRGLSAAEDQASFDAVLILR